MTTKNIVVPDIGGAEDVVVIEMLVKAGDSIEVDTPLLTLESDKATMEVPSSDAGIVQELKVKTGDKVSQGAVILTLEPASEGSATKEKSAPKKADQPKEIQETEEIKEIKEIKEKQEIKAEDIYASPIVRKLAREFGVDLHQITPTGAKQRIQKEDLQDYVKNRLTQSIAGTSTATGLPSAPVVDFAKFGAIETQALSRIKKLSGKNLHRNWVLAPHVTQFGDADITELEAFRVAQKGGLEKQGIKLTPLVFIMKAVTAALKKFPSFNASLDAANENLILKKYFHIGVAVDTPDGLVVPVIRDVDQKSLLDLAKELNTVSEKARAKQLTANDMQGGCFTISSLGGIGGTAFTPIINLPEVAILGVSKSSMKPVYQDGEFIPRLMLPLSLSYDHRVIDGAEGARFITYLSHVLSDIRNLLL